MPVLFAYSFKNWFVFSDIVNKPINFTWGLVFLKVKC